MKSATKQSFSEVSQIKMAQIEPAYWLRLLGDRNGVTGSAGFGRNGHNDPGVELQALSTPPEMLDQPAAYWLRLLGGSGQTDHATDGRLAKAPPQSLGNPQFTPEHWLRLLGKA